MSSMGKEVVSTPYFVVDERRLLHNLEILKQVAEESGCKILLAQKAFSMFSVYPLLRKYLCGTTASGLYEARLGKEEFGGETHVFSPAYRAEEFDELLQYVDDLVFNSPAQVRKYGIRAKNAGKSIGLRVNPECSTQEGHAIYDPCAPGSRLGTTLEAFEEELVPLLDGIHMHTLCEQNSDDLEKTVEALEDKFGKWLPQMKWLNLGGGHHITRADYDRERLVRIIRRLREKYQLEVYLEPGEAVVLNAGDLVASVMEIVHNNMEIAILDIRQHFQGDLGHSCLCITVSSRRVAVYRTEVTLTVHQHIPHGEILRQTHQRIIDRSVTVGVIATQHSTDGIGALMVCLIGCQPLFEHGIENTAVYRFQTVTHVRQCTGNNDRHCILQEGVLHFSANFDGGNFLFSVGKEIFFFH